jgi:hypothetical protein
MINLQKPLPAEYAPYYANYIILADVDIITTLHQQAEAFPAYLRNIPTHLQDYRYAAGKWTVKEVVGHIIDTERIMAYRALRIARADETPLPGFEQDAYVPVNKVASRGLDNLADEFAALRKANMFLIDSFGEEELARMGTASGYPVSVKALLFIMAGHVQHHVNIFEERYFMGKH